MTSTVPRSFAGVTALAPAGPGRFEAEVSPGWTIGGKPNGGYLLAMLGRAAAAVGSHADVISASAVYLSSPEPGPVSIAAEVLRAGRSTTHIRARMTQDGRDCAEALLVTGTLAAGTRPYWDGGVPGPGQTAYGDCPRLVPRLPGGAPVPIMEQVEVRLDPEVSGFTRGQPAGRGELRGWLALPGGEDFDPVSLLYAADSFPPATFDIEFSGWVPTLELTVYVRALPAPGPVRVLQRAQLIGGQRVDEACFVWDGSGRLVAQGVQLAAIRLG